MTTQADIAKHLDLSERRVRDLLKELNIDHKKSTLTNIRIAYIRSLRNQAAGRGGSQQENATRAKIRESEANAQLKELQFHKEVKTLIPANEIEPILANWATLARSETQHAIAKMVAAIESKHGIEVEQGLIDESLGAAFAAIANYPSQSSIDDGAGGDEVETAA